MSESELIQIAAEFPFPYDYVRYCYSLGFVEKEKLEYVLRLSCISGFNPAALANMSESE